MTSIIASIWTSISTLIHFLDVRLIHLFVQACSSDCKFLKASECMCVCDFFHFIGLCPECMLNSCCYGENTAPKLACSSLCPRGGVFPSPSPCLTLMQRF